MYTSTYNFFASADVYDVVVEPYDIFGAGYRSYPYQVVVDPTFNAEWIKDGTLSITKVDNVVKDKLNEASTAIERLDGVDEALDHIDESISELKVNIDSVESTVSNKITQEISQVKQTASSIQTDIQNLKTGDISQLKQTASSLQTTVQTQTGDISQLKQTASSLQTTVQTQTGDISQLKQTASSLQTTVQTQTGDISQLKQTANSIDTKVQNLETNHASLISQNANSITSIVTALGKSPAQSGYAAITQLQDAVNLRVQKGDVINQINLTAAGTKIDGKYLHITATTAIDNDLITSGMIKANAITADKINVSSLSAVCATIGTLRTKTSGARVEISDNLIKVYDSNNTLRVRLGVW
jgi:predicted nuclease with TOPRIM domain